MKKRGATATKLEAEIEQADVERITAEREAEVVEADDQRMLATRRETELNRIAGDLSDDPAQLWMYAEHSLTQSAVSMIDAGRAFIKLKEILPHGEFEAGIKERGITPRSARYISESAFRFADRSEKFLKLGRTKLYACLEFSDDDLDALEDGQSILDVTLDDLDRMTTRELKAAIKKRDADIQVKDQLLEEKNLKIDEVATENAHLRGETTASEVSPQVITIRQKSMSMLADLQLLTGNARRLAEDGASADVNEVAALTGALHNMRIELALAFDVIERAAPAFQAQLEGAAANMDGWKDGIDIPADMQVS